MMPPPTFTSRGGDCRARIFRIAAICAAIGSWLTLVGSATALGLGEIVRQSTLGEPFRITIPVLVNADDLAGDELAPECFRLVASDSERSADLPQVVFGRATLARNAQGVFVIVSSDAVANDPAMSVTVQAGCKLRIRREYTVLLDPPIIREPVAEATPRAETAPPARAAAAAVAGAAHAGATEAPPAAAPRTRSSASSPPPAAAKRAQRVAKSTPKPKPAIGTVVPRAKEDSKPRLRVSRSSQDQGAPRSASDIARGKSDEEIRQEVEAETIVLQRRIAELSATLERMQADLREAMAAREAAERAAKAPAPPAWEPSPWLVSIPLLALVLLLAVIVVRSRGTPLARSVAPLGLDSIAPPEPTHSAADDDDADLREAAPPMLTAAAPTPRNEEDESEPSPQPVPDEEATFDDELFRYAEQRSAYSVLEREHPKIVASVIRDWGKPKVIAYLREILVSPRKPSGGFSRGAVSDLMLLQAIAMERAGYRPEDNPWRIELDARRRREA
jgi:hypothetical protein